MTNYDSPWKEALDVFFAQALELLFPTVYEGIAWEKGFEFLDKELQSIAPDAERGTGEVDKLVKVWLKDGAETWLLLHLEIQAQEAAGFALRMFVYNYRIFDKYNREVVSLAILGDERLNWRPASYRTERWGCSTEFRFPIAKLLDWDAQSAELQANRNPVAHVVLAHLRAMVTVNRLDERRTWKFQLVRNLYDLGMSVAVVRQLFRLIDWMMTLPDDLEIQFRNDVFKIEEERHMPYIPSFERLAREEGRQEGQLCALETFLSFRFKQAGSALFPSIRAIKDDRKIDEIWQALEQGASLEELKNLIAH